MAQPAADVGRSESRASLATTMAGVPFEKRDEVRIAIVGTGHRGCGMLNEWLGVEHVRITALCDVVPDKVEQARQMMQKAGHAYDPAVFTNGDYDFESLCKRDDIDFVYTATPWEWHVPVMLAAMQNGKHCGTEVPAAYTLEDCWKLVDTSESTRRHCIIMENCCYGYNEMLVLTMVRAGVLGQVIAGGAAYNHDLRESLFENRDAGWRRTHHTLRNANLYPTHGLGPVAMYMDVNRGDRFDTLVSMSTGEFGLTAWRAAHEPKDSPKWQEQYVCGDLNRSLVRTAKGRVILLEHNVTSPRPYSRINSVQGTKGIFEDYPARIYIDGPDAKHQWEEIDAYKAEYEHPLWRQLGERARRSAGHGGIDYIQAWRLVQCMRDGRPPDVDVYDAATWSAPGPLSEASLAKGGAPQVFPDFTRGAWAHARATL